MKEKKDWYRSVRRAIRKADRFKMKGKARRVFLSKARAKVASVLAVLLLAFASPSWAASRVVSPRIKKQPAPRVLPAPAPTPSPTPAPSASCSILSAIKQPVGTVLVHATWSPTESALLSVDGQVAGRFFGGSLLTQAPNLLGFGEVLLVTSGGCVAIRVAS